MTTQRQRPAAQDGPEDTAGTKSEGLRIWLLGGFRVSAGERSIEDERWRLRKARSLVKLLALAPGHRMHREQVAGWLWPDSDPKAQANNLRQALHVARRALGVESGAASHYLRVRDEVLTLSPDGPIWVDVEAFETFALRARRMREPPAYRAATELYAGDLLPEDRYEPWAEERRGNLRGTYLTLLGELAALHEERGDHGPAIEALRRVVEAEPTDEGSQARLMRLYAAHGRRREALRQYELLRKSLSEELGAEPDAATQRLYREISAGNVSPTRAPLKGSWSGESSGAGRHNLPAALTSFVGREKEMVEVKRLLAMTRLLTLTGTGGCGKTRLAVEVSRDLAGAYPDGTWLVELAPLAEPELLQGAVAGALGVREKPGRPIVATLADYLRGKDLLLVLDNCEHLVDACARLAGTLLCSCPGLRVLATSREVLGVAGETTWTVPPLLLPDPRRPHTVEDLAGSESSLLFLERARSRSPDLVLTPQNARAVAEICRRLDGMPLAVELAAARVGALSVGQICEKLSDSLELLTGGARTVAPRHRTLRGALRWSHDLLSEPEQELFARLSTFAGGFTLEAAEAMGEGVVEGGGVLELLSRLVDKSLVLAEAGTEGASRYRMLEPVRQYAREKLEATGKGEEARRRHADWYLALAEAAEPELTASEQAAWLERLEIEHDNLRAALAWSLERGDATLVLRLGGALWRFWYVRGHLGEGRRWLERALALGGEASLARAKALGGAAHLAWSQGDLDRATALREEGLELSRRLGDARGIASSLNGLAFVRMRSSDYEAVRILSEEALAIHRELGDKWGAAQSLYLSGLTTFYRGDHATARPLLEEALILFREAGDREGIADSFGALGMAALSQGDYEAARYLMEEARAIFESLSNRRGISKTLSVLGDVALEEGEHGAARALYEEALTILGDFDDKWWISWCLEGVAGVAAAWGQSARAARLSGAAAALREAANVPRPPAHRAGHERNLNVARARLDRATFAAAWMEGRTMTQAVAVEYALAGEEPTPPPARPAPLTGREEEVAVLVARGQTNRQIAAELGISESTVANHVAGILRKLDLRSRAQIAAWTAKRGRLE